MLRSRLLKKSLSFGVFLSLTFATRASLAQETSQAAKLDTLVEGQKSIIKKLDQIQDEVVYVDPLADKKIGVEFNPAYLLLGSADEQLILSGGFSLFQADRGAELAFPIFFRNANKNDLTTLTIDSHYRRFLGRHQNGFYLSGSARYKYAHGREDTDQIPFFDFSQPGEKITLHKFGVGFGIGYRNFSRNRIYWGTSLTVGRYFTGTDKVLADDDIFGGKSYLDIEFLKFGIAF